MQSACIHKYYFAFKIRTFDTVSVDEKCNGYLTVEDTETRTRPDDSVGSVVSSKYPIRRVRRRNLTLIHSFRASSVTQLLCEL